MKNKNIEKKQNKKTGGNELNSEHHECTVKNQIFVQNNCFNINSLKSLIIPVSYAVQAASRRV